MQGAAAAQELLIRWGVGGTVGRLATCVGLAPSPDLQVQSSRGVEDMEEYCIIIAYWIILCRVGQLLDYYTYCAVLARDRVFVFAGAFYTKHRYQLFLLLITSASCCFHGKSPHHHAPAAPHKVTSMGGAGVLPTIYKPLS